MLAVTYERLFHAGRLKKWQKPRTFGVHRIHEAQCTVDLGRSRLACGSPASTEANVSPQPPKQHDGFIPPYPPAIIPTSRKAPRRSKRLLLYDLRIVICLQGRLSAKVSIPFTRPFPPCSKQVCGRVFQADATDYVVLCLSRVFSTGGTFALDERIGADAGCSTGVAARESNAS